MDPVGAGMLVGAGEALDGMQVLAGEAGAGEATDGTTGMAVVFGIPDSTDIEEIDSLTIEETVVL